MASQRYGTGAPPKAVFIDLDNTLADTSRHFRYALDTMLQRRGQRLPDGSHEHLHAPSFEKYFENIVAYFKLKDDDIAALVVEHEETMYNSRIPVALMPGAELFLDALERAGVPLCIVTAAPRVHLEWARGFHPRLANTRAVTCDLAALMGKNKPDPAPYEHACELMSLDHNMQIRPEECSALEDNARGIRSARAAGLCTFGVRSPHVPFSQLLEADWQLDHLGEFDPTRPIIRRHKLPNAP